MDLEDVEEERVAARQTSRTDMTAIVLQLLVLGQDAIIVKVTITIPGNTILMRSIRENEIIGRKKRKERMKKGRRVTRRGPINKSE